MLLMLISKRLKTSLRGKRPFYWKKGKELAILKSQFENSAKKAEDLRATRDREIKEACQAAVDDAIDAWVRDFPTSKLYSQLFIRSCRSCKDEVALHYPELDLTMIDFGNNAMFVAGALRSSIKALQEDELGLQHDLAIIDETSTNHGQLGVGDARVGLA